MTMIEIFAGLAEGQPTFRLEHPFTAIGGYPKSSHAQTDYVKVDGRMRHVRRRPVHFRPQVEISRKTGLPRVVRLADTVTKRDPATSRQVRRALDRANASFTAVGG